ncbi:MAG TPA: hypothetical protein VFD91_14220, partial [Mariniphaga sp.]|nr:hypothetical protein [Mariniphaga sp.]
MNEERIQKILYYAALIIALLFVLAPVLFMISMSLSERADFLGNRYIFTLKHFREILTTESLHFMRYCLNSIVISFVSAIICTAAAGSGAYAFT